VALGEMLQRLFGVRGVVVLVCAVLGSVGAVFVSDSTARTYTASARLVLDMPDPTSEAEANVIGDTAEAVVTSPSAVRQALDAVGASRDPAKFAEESIDVEPLGSSGVMRLSVTDPDADLATDVANSLARDLIQTRLQSRNAPLSAALATLDQRIETLNASIEATNEQLAVASPIARRDLVRQREVLLQRGLLLEQQRAELLAKELEWPRPAIIDHASRPLRADPSTVVPVAALGAFLGLIAGLALAATLESVQPTFVGREIGRQLETPYLGVLRRQGKGDGTPGLQTRLGMAAEAARVDAIEVVGVGITPDPVAIDELRSPGLPPIRTLDTAFPSSEDGGRPGLVLVVPRWLRKTKLEPVLDLQAVADWPLLGILTQRRRLGSTPRITPSGTGIRRQVAPLPEALRGQR
jgi:uncharacterized protein involved in exopolysaccharide biosynthesis